MTDITTVGRYPNFQLLEKISFDKCTEKGKNVLKKRKRLIIPNTITDITSTCIYSETEYVYESSSDGDVLENGKKF